MEFEGYSKKIKDPEMCFIYYKVDHENMAFWDLGKAIEYTINRREPLGIISKKIIYQSTDGKLYDQEFLLWMVPNKDKREITYHVIAADTGAIKPEVICFQVWRDYPLDVIAENIRNNKNFQKSGYDTIGSYQVTVKVNDDNKTITTDYKLLVDVDMKSKKRTKH